MSVVDQTFQALVRLSYVPELGLSVIATGHHVVLLVWIEINVPHHLTMRVLNDVCLPETSRKLDSCSSISSGHWPRKGEAYFIDFKSHPLIAESLQVAI